MKTTLQVSFFEKTIEFNNDYASPYIYMADKPQSQIFEYFNKINTDKDHMFSTDDICTPMECVKTMLDYIPNDFWNIANIRILDPCAGNGNFGAYCMSKTNKENIWFNELNYNRFLNCKQILDPIHISNNDFFYLNDEFNGKWDLIMANPPYSRIRK